MFRLASIGVICDNGCGCVAARVIGENNAIDNKGKSSMERKRSCSCLKLNSFEKEIKSAGSNLIDFFQRQ